MPEIEWFLNDWHRLGYATWTAAHPVWFGVLRGAVWALLGWLALRHFTNMMAHRVAVKIFGKNSLPTPNESAQRIQNIEATAAAFAEQISNQIRVDILTMAQQVR